MKLGCHAVLFKEKILTQTETCFSQIQQTGFAGAEIGSRFFGTEKKEYLQAMLHEYGLNMSGMHSSILLSEAADHGEEAFAGVLKVIDFVKNMPYKNVIMTGMHKLPEDEKADVRLTDETFVRKAAEELNKLALIAKRQGVKLHYHNHSWEFDNDALIFHSLGKYAPDLYFALDTGWAYSSGYDPVELMNQYPDRIHYVHLRDYSLEKGEYVDLGKGDMDYIKLMNKLKEIMLPEDWAVVEYETGEEDYTRYVRAFEYLSEFF